MVDTHETTDNPTTPTIENKPVNPLKGMTNEEKLKLARLAIEQSQAGITYAEFALQHGVSDKSLGYWITKYKKSQRPKREQLSLNLPTVTKQTENELINNLKQQIDHLTEQLQEANRKIKSLQNVILILGHQHSEDEE